MSLKSILKKTKLYEYYSCFRRYYATRWDRKSVKELKKNGSKVLVELEEILCSNGIRHFFDFGTLLGIVRDNGIISGDGDIDIGVIIDSTEDKKKIESLLNNKNIEKVRQFDIENYGVAEESYFYKKKVRFDLHYYYGYEDERFCFLFYKLPGREYSSPKTFDSVKVQVHNLTISEYEFNSKKISLPKNPKNIIVQKYGVNWRIPDRGWPYWEGPCSEKIPEKGCAVLFKR